MPGGVLHQHPAERRAEQRTHLAGQGDEGHRRHVLTARDDFHHRQAANRHHHRTADALQHAGEYQLIERGGLRAEQGAGGKQHDGAKKDIPHPDPIRQPAAGGQHHRHRQHIGDNNHMHMQRALPEALRHGGEGGVNDSGIQRLHKKAEGHYPQLPAHAGGKICHVIRLPVEGLFAKNAAADGRRTDRPPAWCTGSAADSSPGRRQW